MDRSTHEVEWDLGPTSAEASRVMRKMSGRQGKDVHELFKGRWSMKDQTGRAWRLEENPEAHGLCRQCRGVPTSLKGKGCHFDQMGGFGGFHTPLASWAQGRR